MTFDILRRTRKEKGSLPKPICIMQVLYFQIRPYFWTAIINTKTLAYKSWFLCTPRIASAPLSTSPPGLQPMTFGAASHPHMPICYVKQLKVWHLRNSRHCQKKFTQQNLRTKFATWNIPNQTYQTKTYQFKHTIPSKVDLWTANLNPPSQFTLGYEVTELRFWDLTTCVTMWMLHNVWTLYNQTHTYTHHFQSMFFPWQLQYKIEKKRRI